MSVIFVDFQLYHHITDQASDERELTICCVLMSLLRLAASTTITDQPTSCFDNIPGLIIRLVFANNVLFCPLPDLPFIRTAYLSRLCQLVSSSARLIAPHIANWSRSTITGTSSPYLVANLPVLGSRYHRNRSDNEPLFTAYCHCFFPSARRQQRTEIRRG